MIDFKKSHQHMCSCACVCGGRARSSTSLIVSQTWYLPRDQTLPLSAKGVACETTSLIALYVNLNEAVAQLVRITHGYTFISSVSYVCLPQQYVAHFHIAPEGAFIKHTRLMSDFHPRLEQPSKVKFYARVSSRAPLLYLKNKQPNLALLSGRLTSSSDLATS